MIFKSSIVIVLLYVGIAQGYSNYKRNLRDSATTCGDTGVQNYCSDCVTATFCSGGEISSTTTCADGYSCSSNGDITGCFDESVVESCQCPSEGQETLPDPYDNQKFLLCLDGARTIEECPSEMYFQPDTKKCDSDPPPDPSTPSPPLELCTGDVDLVSVTCTSFRICHSDGTTEAVVQCDSGYLFNTELNECIKYEPFSCPDEDEAKYYADTHDCSIYYLCYQGEIVGQPLSCQDGQIYDNNAQTCSSNGVCDLVEDCGICPNDQERFVIDCDRYYQCTASDSGDLDYVPVETSCGSGLYFDAETGECSASVAGCPA